MFLSEHYAAKAWPNHERQHALAGQLASGRNRILPVRFDDTTIPGLPPTVGYVDARVRTPVQIGELIMQKLQQP